MTFLVLLVQKHHKNFYSPEKMRISSIVQRGFHFNIKLYNFHVFAVHCASGWRQFVLSVVSLNAILWNWELYWIIAFLPTQNYNMNDIKTKDSETRMGIWQW